MLPPPVSFAPGGSAGILPVGPYPPPPGPSRRSDHRTLAVFLGIVAVVVVVLVVLLTVPVQHPFRAVLAPDGDLPAEFLWTFPSGAPVSGTWSTVGGEVVNFSILTPTGNIYSEVGSSGSFSFTATFGLYDFEATSSTPVTVEIAGSYSAPLI